MAAGDVHPPESRMVRDAVSGCELRQVTTHPSVHHHPFYYLPAYDDAMRHLVFVSHRTGRPEIFVELRESGRLLQVTEHPGLAEWSLHPSHDGRYVYFTDASGAWRVEIETCREDCLVSFPGAEMRERGMVGAAMGTTTLSRDDRWWAVPVKHGGVSQFTVIDTHSGKHEVILERDTIGHPQFHPDDPMLLRYAGPYYDRIWTIRRDGTDNRLVYRRDVARKQWIVHETWIPGSQDILTANWPHGLLRINSQTGEAHSIAQFNAWHPMINRRGTRVVADTNFPDTGLWLFELADGAARPLPLCASRASNQGAHWNTDHCPYDDGPVKVEAPQHSHPHPTFAPDDSVVLFTSDESGHAQVFECAVPAVAEPRRAAGCDPTPRP